MGDYLLHECLFLSAIEETTINNIIQNIHNELDANIDQFSKLIIISQIESLLSYAGQFYNRQFITREKTNHQILDRLEKLVGDYFNSGNLMNRGLPTVKNVAEQLNLSPEI